jgi:zinc protease
MKAFGSIEHYILKNGLQVIINPDPSIPKVSVQLWYNVGSKDEKDGEKGLAHLLEHMIFKGTNKLSESDINMITQKLSGYTNAFTSYDYTGYLFDFPKQHWQAALEMLSDCMTNCTFPDDMLQSELKAVIQELKMYKDNYVSSLIETMTSAAFSDHPYHHPIIGYKQDLWNITRDGLVAFYKKHYKPNNATLVVAGDVDPSKAIAEIENYFGAIPAGDKIEKVEHYAQQDMQSTSATLYRDIQRPLLMYAWRVPGIKENSEFLLNVLAHIVGQSQNSRLYRLLVDELQLATDVSMFLDDLFEHGLLFFHADPVDKNAIEKIEKKIEKVLVELQESIDDDEISRAIKQVSMGHLVQGETLQERAYMMGKGFLATKNPQYINEFIQTDERKIKEQIKELISKCLRATTMHKGVIAPLPASEKKHWIAVQEESDRTDEVILSRKVRETDIEPGKLVHHIETKKMDQFVVPQHERFDLQNGLKVLFSPTSGQKIELVLEFESQFYCDPDHLQGLCNFTFALLEEGTKNFSKVKLVQELASRGMHLDVGAGSISLTLLKEDLDFALQVIDDLVENALFDEKAIEKVRAQILSDIDDFWDEPNQFIKQIAREHIYQDHPYNKQFLGTKESIAHITRDDLLHYYRQHIVPNNACLAVVGAFDENDLEEKIKEIFNQWEPVQSVKVSYPHLVIPKQKEIIHPITRDQVVLAFTGLSVDRKNPMYDPLLVFDQIFAGGVTGSMSSHLFQLREQTGLFYTIGGSLVYGAGHQPGMFFIKTIVSQDRLHEAERVIKQTMQKSSQQVDQQEFRAAKDALSHSLIDQFATQKGIAHSFLLIDRLALPKDFYAQRVNMIEKVDHNEMMKAVQKIMDVGNISTIKVGRL